MITKTDKKGVRPLFHKRGLTPFLLMILLAAGCGTPPAERLYASPSMLPHTTPAMRTAGYWIGRHPFPGKVMLNSDEIADLNAGIVARGLVKDLARWPTAFDGDIVKTRLTESMTEWRDRKWLRLDGTPVAGAFWSSMAEMQNIEAIPPHIQRRYGIVTAYADQRLLPTETGLYAKAFDEDFDELQNSALDIGTPVVIAHTSADAQWVYVLTDLSDGWVRADSVAEMSDEDFSEWQSKRLAVVIAPKADIFLDAEQTRYHGYARMGAHFGLNGRRGSAVEVSLPVRAEDGGVSFVFAFIPADQIHEGYLDYTPRTVLTQAFKMLHQPYGWGGMYGEQDCSRFLQEVFATVGIQLPRNSGQQIRVGTNLARGPDLENTMEEKLALLQEKAVGGATVLGMAGHIMLYVGDVDGRPYAIHAVWAYRQSGKSGDDIYVLNRVTLSDLSLGEGSKKGSLLRRLNAARWVGLDGQ